MGSVALSGAGLTFHPKKNHYTGDTDINRGGDRPLLHPRSLDFIYGQNLC